MIKSCKGYSLGILVITIAVMIILTTVAVVSFKDMTSDKIVTNFMNDIQEVEEYVKEYYSTKRVLPILYDAYNEPIVLSDYEFEEIKDQTSDRDFGKYYYVDLDKLERIHLKDKDRGYVVNENSLKVYVTTPITYEGLLYYTVTDNMSGYEKSYNDNANFEIIITGNPTSWTDKARILLSVPNLVSEDGSSTVADAVSLWTFKYYTDGPITAEEFKDKGKLFLYGEIVEIYQNGIVSFYVENDKGFSKVVNVNVTKVDDIKPTIKMNGDRLDIIDNETGINPDKFVYKIIGYDDLTDAEGGRDVLTYGIRYKKYIDDFKRLTSMCEDLENKINDLRNSGSGESELLGLINDLEDAEAELSELNTSNRDFNENGVPYGDTENNIAIYAVDFAGNEYAYKAGTSREVLLRSSLIDYELQLLSNSMFSVVRSGRYISGDKVNLRIRSQGATKMLITLDSTISPENVSNYRLPYESSNGGYEYDLGTVYGDEITIYAYFTAEEVDENGRLIYEALSDTFLYDNVPPTNDKPEVTITNKKEVSVVVKQKDTGSGITDIQYGYMLSKQTENISAYTWLNTVSELESALKYGESYYIRTKVNDEAGNGPVISEYTTVQCPTKKTNAIPNAPVLGTMRAITWKNNLEEVYIDPATMKDEDGVTRVWYDYAYGDGVTDSGTSKWANAKSEDGSYWVWIPRYAYKIIYYTDSTKSQIKGFYQNSAFSNVIGYYKPDGKTLASENEVKTLYGDIEIVFLYNTEDYKYYDAETKVVNSLIEGGEKIYSEYIVHPAFRGDSAVGTNNLGRWSRELSGFWVAKFEASRSDASYTSVGTANTIKILPSVKGINNITINEAYNLALNYNAISNSHLMKNSEWGAVSYLAHSAYGRNGKEVKPNLATNQVTGAGATSNGSTYSATSLDLFESRYGYKTSSGFLASTTNNIYGVYDLVGGNKEFVSAYISNGSSVLTTNGANIQSATTPHTVQIYNKGATDTSANNFAVNLGIFGDGIYELATTENYIWGNSSLNYPQTDTPFFVRGGDYNSGYENMGIFSTSGVSGASNSSTGFRVILAP